MVDNYFAHPYSAPRLSFDFSDGVLLDHAAAAAGNSGGAVMKEHDRLLPIANVGRKMKQILPPNAKISKEAKETMQECVSEFISFVTAEASDHCHRERRKTVNGDDVCWALAALGFDDYADPLRRYLHRYRELEGERAAAAAASHGVGGTAAAGDGEEDGGGGDESSSSRCGLKLSGGQSTYFHVI
ncbi:unnamed protein product [Linum trigynum]|uniref:Transcription factor CBF/NF-Y/archaeal histone domain-containing protein n=1 Tax=Linum trigynum TaxID=586398 RepID=A0AAV2EWN7_9ROSI